MDDILNEDGELFDLQGIHSAVEYSTDSEFEALTRDYVEGLDMLAMGAREQAAACGLALLETLLEIEARLRQERTKEAA